MFGEEYSNNTWIYKLARKLQDEGTVRISCASSGKRMGSYHSFALKNSKSSLFQCALFKDKNRILWRNLLPILFGR